MCLGVFCISFNLLMLKYAAMYKLSLIFLLARHLAPVNLEDATYKDITIIVMSQANSYHLNRTNLFLKDVARQIMDLQLQKTEEPRIFISQALDFLSEKGLWTLFPLFSKYSKLLTSTKWTLVCEEDTRIDLPKLLKLLKQYNFKEEVYLGRGLYHYNWVAFDDLKIYSPRNMMIPDRRAGFVLSREIVDRLSIKLETLLIRELNFNFNISINAEREFTSYLLYLEVRLTNVSELCVEEEGEEGDCVTHHVNTFPTCGPAVPIDELSIAVKTCEEFHDSRVLDVVKKTWGQESPHIEYFSEDEDPRIPTLQLGVPETQYGHCGKTMAIITRAATDENQMKKKWLLIADDDTIISIERLRLLLACYDSSTSIALGERFGYRTAKAEGYDFITGGAGMVFSWPVVKRLAEECSCPSNSQADDMQLGQCLSDMAIPIIHSPYFHQFPKTSHYAAYLEHRSHVSFHKHDRGDPLETYNYLTRDLNTLHDEL